LMMLKPLAGVLDMWIFICYSFGILFEQNENFLLIN
jgi:hypothetical protein